MHSMGHEKHGVTVFGEGLRALSVRMLPRSTEQGEARKRLPGGAPAGEMFTGVGHSRTRLAGGGREIRTAGPQDGVLFRVYLSAAAAPLGTFCRQYADRARICLPAKPLCPIIRENEIDATLLLSLTPDDLKDLGITLGGHRQRFSTPLRHFAPQCAPTHPLILYGYHSRLAKRWPPSRKRNARGQTATGLEKCVIPLTGFRGCAAGFRPPLRVTTARKRLLVRVCLTYFASGRSAPTAKALASSNRRRRKAGSSIR